VKTRKIKSVEHPLFQDSLEFSQYMPNTPLVADWRLGLEGDWVSTEDGQVCQVLKRGSLKASGNKKIYNYYIRTIMGSFVCKPSIEIKGEMKNNIYTFGKDRTKYEIKKNRVKPTTNEFLFAKYVAKGDNITDAFISAYPTDNKDYAEREAKILMSTKRVQGLIKEEIEKVMNEAEITPLYILEKMKDIIESEASRDSDKVSLLKELVSIAGMRDTEKKSESVTLFQGFSPEQLKAIGNNEVKQIASAERKVEE
tara:strand:- start:91 stop:852 length:762 start_codon:yes stop_codon:yes gene_type:complete